MSTVIIRDSIPGSDGADPRWWESSSPGRSMVSVAQRIRRAQEKRRLMLLRYARLYTNQPVPNLYQLGLSQDHDTPGWDYQGQRISFNVISSVVDAVQARLAKNYVRAQFVTEGGNWEAQRRAKLLTQYGEGLVYETDWHDSVGQEVFLDSLIFDGGVAHIWGDREAARVRAERVLPFEILVDEAEAIDGSPRQQYREKYVHRDVLLASQTLNPGNKGGKGGKNERKILESMGVDPTEAGGDGQRSTDMIPVYVGWRLPSSEGRDDGATLVAVEGGELTGVEKWDRPRFPHQVFRWKRRRMGFWGDGLVSQLMGLQVEMNKLLQSVQRAMHFSVPRWFVEAASEVVNEDINDQEHAIVRYRGNKPESSTPATVHPEVFAHIDRIYAKAFELAGISQMSATSQKPAGVNAAIALQTLQDVETQRFVLPAKRWETMNIQSIGRMIDESRRLYRSSVDAQVMAPGTDFIRRIKWSEVDLDEDAVVIRPKPTSIIPESVPGRLQIAHDLAQSGVIDSQQFLSLIDHPDTRAALDLSLGEQRHVTRTLEDMLDTGQYSPPEPFQDVALARRLAANLYFRSKEDAVPEDRRQLVLMYLSDLQRIEQGQAQLQQPRQAQPQPATESAAPAGGLIQSAIPAA